jgi:pseudaminic acid biosynthesis-associated methylase
VLTDTEKAWTGSFGKAYTDRNNLALDEYNALYNDYYGLTRLDLNREFLADIDPNSRVLEVGSNVGNQLNILQGMGFKDLWGIEISEYAIEIAKKQTKNINIVKSPAYDIPFKDKYFDMVFTSCVLIHIHPNILPSVLDEIYRTSKKYIWGFEYFAESNTEIEYRGRAELMWKNNFSKMYIQRHADLCIVKERKLKYKSNDNVDSMFLLSKG